MADTYNLISIVAFVLSAVFLIISIVLFFKLNIRKVVGDLSGRNVRKSIEMMKKNTQKQDDTNMYTENAISYRKISEVTQETYTTEKITEPLKNNNETATTVLGNNENKGTTVLGADVNNGTTVLTSYQLLPPSEQFIVEKEITFIHTNEVYI